MPRKSQVLGQPAYPFAHVLRLRRNCMHQTSKELQHRSPHSERRRLPAIGLSELNSMASGLAVYASQSRLPVPHARLASSRWSDATGRAFHPQGSIKRFQSCFLTCSSSFSKLLGAMSREWIFGMSDENPSWHSFPTGDCRSLAISTGSTASCPTPRVW